MRNLKIKKAIYTNQILLLTYIIYYVDIILDVENMVDRGPNNKKYTITINKGQFISEIRIIEEKLFIIKIRIEHYNNTKKTSCYEKICSTILQYICSQKNIIHMP